MQGKQTLSRLPLLSPPSRLPCASLPPASITAQHLLIPFLHRGATDSERGTMRVAETVGAWLNHYTQVYYLLHYIAFGLFAYARLELASRDFRTVEEEKWYDELVGNDMTGIPREKQIWACLGMVVMTRAFRAKSAHELISMAIGFSKACICVTLFIADWYYPFYFIGLWIFIFFVTSEPSFETPHRKFVKMDKKKMFDIVFSPVGQEKEQAQVYWFINVWASWQKSGASRQFNPVFAEMSAKYSNDFCKFTKIDAGRAFAQPVIQKLEIDDSALSKHMPSMVLFKNGKEVKRLPEKGKTDVSYLHEYSPAQIERYFNMDKILEETKKKTATRRETRRKQDAESKKTK
eukprot:TRINITY_DN15005_c0_g1_i1.p1 TRINITY_DN15005_c0_g1~~TRINITY_DN15005_c0_g1_i1.p1  ORF type:complete len:348 (+),score=134.89 TRINITY_DN15005_c0_g1_i1:231-1274(+)